MDAFRRQASKLRDQVAKQQLVITSTNSPNLEFNDVGIS